MHQKVYTWQLCIADTLVLLSAYTSQKPAHSYISKLCAFQDTPSQDSRVSQTPRNVADPPQRSMSRQYSLRSHHSLQASRRTPEAPPPQHYSRAPAEAAVKAADDKAPKAGDDVPSKEEEGKKPGQEGASTTSEGEAKGAVRGQGISQVLKSPFDLWRAEGSSSHKDQTAVSCIQHLSTLTQMLVLPHELLTL